ncbi:MAG TPA: FtsX-like permease family protein [Actinocatenispora sp.]
MAGWLVTVRGIRYRSGRSLVVFLLAMVATTAAVLAPAYTRTAEQSALTDTLRAVPAGSLGVTVSGSGASDVDLSGLRTQGAELVGARHELSAVLGQPYAGAVGKATVSSLSGSPSSFVVYRSQVCAHVRLTAGHCPTAASGDVLVHADTARRFHVRVGDRLAFHVGDPDTPDPSHRVAGIYRVTDSGEAYWWGGGWFGTAGGSGQDPQERIQPLLSTDPYAAAWRGVTSGQSELDYPVDVDAVRLSAVPALRAQLGSLDTELSAITMRLGTGLPAAFRSGQRAQDAVAASVPVVAVPLVLLCWFVLYLMVASLTEERGPEIALAKLRGFRGPAAVRFGLGEALALIVLAAPVGLAAGLAVVELIARAVLAAGTHAELTAPVAYVTLVALAGAALAAVLAARRTMASPVMALLRRIPARGRWRATVVEGAVVALAAAALYQVLSDPTSRLGLIAPPLLALVAGLVAARLLGFVAGRRLRWSRGRLRPAALLGAAQLARRPLAQRIVVTVTVAVSLLSFAAAAWDVAGHNRVRVAQDRIGADTVYTVSAAGPQAVRDAVDTVDPRGRSLMPAMQTEVHYGDGDVTVLAVDPDRLARTAAWSGLSTDRVRALARTLPGAVAPTLTVRGPLSVSAVVDAVPRNKARGMQLVAVVARPDGTPREVPLGAVRPGGRTYRAALPGCADGCSLTGLGLSRYPGDFSHLAARLRVTAVSDGGRRVDAGLTDPGRWRYAASAPQTTVSLSTRGGLGIDCASDDPADVVVAYHAEPARLPVVLSGPAPADDAGASRFEFPAFGGTPVPFAVTGRTDVVPRAGRHALLVDLGNVQRLLATQLDQEQSDTPPTYQVWAGPGAPPDLARRLAAAGVPVLRTDSLAGTLDRLGRQAPALALRLYLVAGVAALLLALGAVLLTAYVGVDARLYEMAALRVAGLRQAELSAAVRREYRLLLGVPLVAGLVAGAAGAVLMLPAIRLVTDTDAGVRRVYELGPWWVPGAVLVTVAGLVAAALAVARMLGHARPAALREGAR